MTRRYGIFTKSICDRSGKEGRSYFLLREGEKWVKIFKLTSIGSHALATFPEGESKDCGLENAAFGVVTS